MIGKSVLTLSMIAPGAAVDTPAPAPFDPALLAANDSGDTAMILGFALMVLLLALPGLALANSTMVRRENRVSIFAQTGAMIAMVSLLWAVVGYTLAFGQVGGGFLGMGNAWMLISLSNVRPGTAVPETAFVLFQMAAALIPLALMAGAWAERTRFFWAVGFAGLWSLLVYAPITHWIWGGGWLATRFGVIDHAGGLVIFTTAAVSAMTAVLLIGKRRHTGDGSQDGLFRATGIAIVWGGMLALTGGMALAATDDASSAMLNAHLAAVASVLVWLVMEKLFLKRPTATGWTFAALAGLAAAAAPAGFVSPGGALIIGVVAAIAAWGAQRIIRLDDVAKVTATVGIPAMVGVLLTAIFASPDLGGVGYPEGMGLGAQLTAQAVGIAAVTLWSAIGTAIAALMVSVIFPMRVTEAEEAEGLDASTHGIGV